MPIFCMLASTRLFSFVAKHKTIEFFLAKLLDSIYVSKLGPLLIVVFLLMLVSILHL
jgi:hypothetical protein